MCERNAFYIQASCLYLEAYTLRDSEQSTRNITLLSTKYHCRTLTTCFSCYGA